MMDRAVHLGMEVVERTLYDLADAYAVPIAELHGVLDDTDEQCPHAWCFDVQGYGEPYGLAFTPRQLIAIAAQQDANRGDIEELVREKLQAVSH